MNYIKLNPHVDDLKYATDGAAGIDLEAAIDEWTMLAPGQTRVVPTGVAVEIPRAHVGLLFARSGLATKHGIGLANHVGVIDADYRGEIKVALHNSGTVSYALEPQQRIAQLVILPIWRPELNLVTALSETARGDGGFGSTGTGRIA